MRTEFHTGIQTVDVKTEKLITKLKENKEKHKVEYNESVDGWKEDKLTEMVQMASGFEDCARQLLRQAELLNAKYDIEDTPKVYSTLPEPIHHLQEYTHVIAMMEASVHKEQTLTSEQFAKYWLDQWDWTESFKMSAERYTKRGPIGG